MHQGSLPGQGVMCRSGLSPEFLELAKAGHIEAWNLPLGMSKPCHSVYLPAHLPSYLGAQRWLRSP